MTLHNILPVHRLTMLYLWIISCTLIPSQQAMAYQASMEYYHYNHQGSLLEVYDGASNKRLLSQAWSPWGERQILHATTSNANNTAALLSKGLPVHMGYTGHKELLSTGLTFAGDTRLYDARLKRFLNSDDRTTGGVRGQNRYSYAYNNPMTFIDPDGRAPRRGWLSWFGGGRLGLRRGGSSETVNRFHNAALVAGTVMEAVSHVAQARQAPKAQVPDYVRLTPTEAEKVELDPVIQLLADINGKTIDDMGILEEVIRMDESSLNYVKRVINAIENGHIVSEHLQRIIPGRKAATRNEIFSYMKEKPMYGTYIRTLEPRLMLAKLESDLNSLVSLSNQLVPGLDALSKFQNAVNRSGSGILREGVAAQYEAHHTTIYNAVKKYNGLLQDQAACQALHVSLMNEFSCMGT